MNSLYFEQVLVPARAIALMELAETFLAYHKNLDESGVYATRQAFRLLLEMFPQDKPLPDTSNFKPGYLVWFKQTVIKKDTPAVRYSGLLTR